MDGVTRNEALVLGAFHVIRNGGLHLRQHGYGLNNVGCTFCGECHVSGLDRLSVFIAA